MKRTLSYLFFFNLVFIIFCSCESEPVAEISLIPRPTKVIQKPGIFDVKDERTYYYSGIDRESLRYRMTGLGFVETDEKSKASVVFSFDTTMIDGQYELEVASSKIDVKAKGTQGFMHALSTIDQLRMRDGQTIPCVQINDVPKFSYRGMHLDVARHFFSVESVKQYIDLLAFYKFNYFHWHLTEDQGWRIEIKKYPKLQEIAAYRKETLIGHYTDQPQQFDGKEYGGFYTQDEIREVVKYATLRGITIVPEIEMPGHSLAALAAYPELACTDGPFEVGTKWGVFEDVYCPTEKTFEFLRSVIDEVVDLFPGPYIHIGGDECPKTRWRESSFCQKLISELNLDDEHGLQSYFIQRMETYINSKGKRIIGWDEILEGGLAKDATVMSWRGYDGGIEAASDQHEVIMTPTSHCYFDYYQSTDKDEPLAIGGFLPLDKVYNFDPIPEDLDSAFAKYIIGAQGNVWTEYMPDFDQVIYMAFPRALALSEILWTYPENRNYNEFLQRLETHIEFWAKNNVQMANHLYSLELDMSTNNQGQIMVKPEFTPPGCKLGLLDSSGVYVVKDEYALESGSRYSFQWRKNGQNKGKEYSITTSDNAAFGQSINLKYEPHSKYEGYGATTLINGIPTNPKAYSGKEWLGFDGKDMVATIDLGDVESLNYGSIEFFNSPDSWIYPPREILVEASADNEHYVPVFQQKIEKSENKYMLVELPLRTISTRYLRVRARNHGTIKSGQGEGNPAWLFVGEITL